MEVSTRVVSLSILLVLINWNSGNLFCTAQTKGRLIFEDNFDSSVLNRSLWSREIRIPQDPVSLTWKLEYFCVNEDISRFDFLQCLLGIPYEDFDFPFCIYHKHDETVQIGDGTLRIKPRLFDEAYGDDAVYIGHLRLADCTSSIADECSQQATSYHILPPVISAKLVTRNHFEFRYGVIEVRAKFPEGDWLYPEIYLEPLYKSYDPRYGNARINLGRVRGNSLLSRSDSSHDDYGSRLVEFGVGNGTGASFKEELVTKLRWSGGPWNKDFHVYKTTWTPKGFSFHVDNELVGRLVPTNDGWSTDGSATAGSLIPFDEKFYLSIGLGVGGVNVFPDDTQTNTYVKPWKNVNAKAMLLFWEAKEKWLPTWQKSQGSKTAVEIDYVRVWTLD